MAGAERKSKVVDTYKAQKAIDEFVKKMKVKEQRHQIKNEHADYVSSKNFKNRKK